jgi:hypothetical protein
VLVRATADSVYTWQGCSAAGQLCFTFFWCFEPFSRILQFLSCVEFSQALALVVAAFNHDLCAARSSVVGRVLNFLQRDLPLFEEDDEDFELGGGGQTGGAGGEGEISCSFGVLCVVRLRV